MQQDNGRLAMRTVRVRLRFIVEPDDGNFYAHCPELKGLHVDGRTEQEALQAAFDAASAYLMSLIARDQPIPIGVVEEDKEISITEAIKELLVAIGTRMGIVNTGRHSYIKDLDLQPA
jgi:predicted RNase H-like HicB family nuclease